jgi:hypothetical protein
MIEAILIDDKYESECPVCGSTNITADDEPMSTYKSKREAFRTMINFIRSE